MVEQVTFQTLFQFLQTVGILVGVFYYVMTLNYTRKNQEETQKTRKMAIFHQLTGSLISSPEGIKNIRVLERYSISSSEEHQELLNNSPEYFDAWFWIMTVLDLSGIYLKAGVMDVEMHAQIHPWWFLRFWERYEDMVYDLRKRFGPSYFRNVDYIMNALGEYLKEHPELKI